MDTNATNDWLKKLELAGAEMEPSDSAPELEFLSKKDSVSSTEKTRTATLIVYADTDIVLYCDGDLIDLFKANAKGTIPIPVGKHKMTIVSDKFDEIKAKSEIVAEEDKKYLLNIKLKSSEDAIIQKNKGDEKELRIKEAQDNIEKGKKYYDEHIYDYAIECFKKAYEITNDSEALLFIGKCCEGQDGDNESIRDYVQALSWYRKAALMGNAVAQFYVGEYYYTGRVVEKNNEEAVRWYAKAVEQNYVKAQYRLGSIYTTKSFFLTPNPFYSPQKGLMLLRTAAECGHAEAQYELGEWCYYANHIEHDYKEAVKWFAEAAKQNHTEAFKRLGSCYRWGHGVAKNFVEALKWFEQYMKIQKLKGENVDSDILFEIGECYEGIGHYDEAVDYFYYAAQESFSNDEAEEKLRYYAKRGYSIAKAFFSDEEREYQNFLKELQEDGEKAAESLGEYFREIYKGY